MHFKIILYAFLIFLGLSAKTYSRIGETKNECIKRYGTPIGSKEYRGDTFTVFTKGGFRICVQFMDNKVALITFQKTKEDILGQSEKISDNEIEILLNRNGGGKSWTEKEQLSLDRAWFTEDVKIYARYSYADNGLSIVTWEKMNAISASEKRIQAEKLDDF